MAREDDPVDVLRRWAQFGGTWQVLSLGEPGPVVVSLCRCDGGEEVERLTYADPDPALARFLREHGEPESSTGR